MVAAGEVTKLLRSWRDGDAAALDTLTPLIYRELHKIAASQMRLEAQGHTLTPTGLLHEAFLKLVQSGSQPDWQDRKHFFVVAAGAMRQLLVDHARRRGAGKRSATPAPEATPLAQHDVIDLDRALHKLAAEDARRAQMLELRYFGGLGMVEIAEALDCSAATISRELRVTEAWLAREIRGEP